MAGPRKKGKACDKLAKGSKLGMEGVIIAFDGVRLAEGPLGRELRAWVQARWDRRMARPVVRMSVSASRENTASWLPVEFRGL